MVQIRMYEEYISICLELFNKIKNAGKIFFSELGVIKIQQACENKRLEFLDNWKKGIGPDISSTGISFEKAIEESVYKFELYEPELIVVKFDQEILSDTDAPMALQMLKNGGFPPQKFIMYVDQTKFEKNDSEFFWKINDSYRGFKLIKRSNHQYQLIDKVHTSLTSSFHEFMHASGDATWLSKPDGIVRPEFIALNAVLELLNERITDARAP